ncbi:MAG: phosphate/phosphite/phosphonate ABC transporter substrate-binding protein, partial [Candidatus Riflebacteria bacterium]|nr:phosphate/phosphite/phosphonate ABC transporter substrate-binding protein [Candidatus Riflebacteria bacterium]
MRSLVLVLLPWALVLGLCAGCGDWAYPRLSLDTHPVLNFGFLPYSDEGHMRGLFNALTAHLGEHTKIEYRFILTPDYQTMGRLMGNRMVDLAWFTPASYAMIGKKVGAQALCKPYRRGGHGYRPIIVVVKGSPVKTLAELRGKRFAYVDRNSTSGFVMPNRMLAEIGVTNPLTFFSSVDFTFSHVASLVGLKDGRYDAAAVYEGAPQDTAAKLGADTFRVLKAGREVPNDPIVARAGLDKA